MSNRRNFLGKVLAGAVSAIATPFVSAKSPIATESVKPNNSEGFDQANPWEEMNVILKRIKPPAFPNKDFDITKFGAVSGGTFDCTESIKKAIEACHKSGGGRVLVPAGTYLTGAVHLKSNVNLHISEGATLQFSSEPAKYLQVVRSRWEGTELMNYSPLIYAYEQENIAVTGEGMLDGSASDENWWGWARRGTGGKESKAMTSVRQLREMGDTNVPVEKRLFGEGHFLRPSFIAPFRCKNILIEDISIIRSPFWEITPTLCSNITVRRINISSHGPNNDGCDPDSCRDVLIEECLFDTGDDCIAIKSGRDNDGRRVGVPSENIIVRNCTMKDGHGGVVIGSEISGGCRNVFVENCKMDSPNLDRALRFKSNAVRGGVLENVFMRNIEVGQVTEAVLTIDFLYDTGAKGDFKPSLKNVLLENVNSSASPRVMWIVGFEGVLIENVKFVNCRFQGLTSPDVVNNTKSISFSNVSLEPAKKGRSANSPQGI